jgi:G3E family GTPase
MTGPAQSMSPGAALGPSDGPFELALGAGEPPWCFTIPVQRAGCYALFTQHLPAEFQLRLADDDARGLTPIGERAFVASHRHDDTVSSVGLEFDGAFDEARLNAWLGRLLRERGTDIFRMKGILAIAGADRRFVFQGVHMLFDGRPDAPWGDRPRHSQVVFIGKHLDRAALREGLGSCLA